MLNIYNVCFVGFNVPLTVFQSFWDTFCLHKTDSFASLWYPTVDKWNDTTPSHIILTPGQPVLELTLCAERQAQEIYQYHFGRNV